MNSPSPVFGGRCPRLTRAEGSWAHRTALVAVPSREHSSAKPVALSMDLTTQSILIILVVGIVAGWLAGQVVFGTGLGCNGILDVLIEPVTKDFKQSLISAVRTASSACPRNHNTRA